ncbi:MAG: glycosyltransferase, partial [Pseudomonadota bacterium]
SGPPAVLRRYNNMPRIKAFGWVDDMKRHYRKAQLFIAPLQIGGGTRLKLLDAAAHGLPIVSTTKGAEGIGLRGGADFWKADTPFAFTRSVARALDVPSERMRRARNARCYVVRQHDLRQITERAADVFRKLLN